MYGYNVIYYNSDYPMEVEYVRSNYRIRKVPGDPIPGRYTNTGNHQEENPCDPDFG